MRVVEQFSSLNGEGPFAGTPAYFIRFERCNLRCTYCDTPYALDTSPEAQERAPQELAECVRKSGLLHVTLTGGEPLLQREMPELLRALFAIPDLEVEIETNGSIPIAPYCCAPKRPRFTMDIKLPSSGEGDSLFEENLARLLPGDVVKFVCGDRHDLETALALLRTHRLEGRIGLHFSPVFGAISLREIAEFLLAHKLRTARLQPQLHKWIWPPDARGV